MNVLIAVLIIFLIVALTVFLHRLRLFNTDEKIEITVLIAVLVFFLLAAVAVIVNELGGLNIAIPGISVIITILAFFFVLAVVVISHELGHFATAKACGVKVEEFGIGYPPRIFAVKYGETEYSLNWIPLGGFTKMAERKTLK